MALENPKYSTVILNQKLETYHVDELGNKVLLHKPAGTGPGCYPAIEPTISLESWASTSTACGNNLPYQTKAIFLISSTNKIVTNNPSNTTQLTRGRMIVTVTSTGAAVYTNNSITTSLSIVNAGADPSDPTRTLYRVSWLNQSVPANVFNGNNTIRLGLYYYTECSEESQYPYTAIGNITNLGGLSACNIVSNMDFYYPNIFAVAACSCCTPDIIPSKQQVEFYTVQTNGSLVLKFARTLNANETYIPSNIELPPGTTASPKTYNVRYRNVGTNGC